MTEGLPKTEVSIMVREREFYRQLGNLPVELAEQWSVMYEDLPEGTKDFFDCFNTFLKARNQALSGSLEVGEDLSEELMEEINQVQTVIRETFSDPQYFLGNGYTAEVYQLPVAPHLCVKYIHDQVAYNQSNHMRVEHDYLAELRNFSIAGVRTPVPYFVRIHPSEGHSYGMERIMGKNLSQILERPSDNIELIRLIKSLDRKKVQRSIISYIQALHDDFKITHGDLFRRNIMVDVQGSFYVIDFGKAKREEVGEDHEARRKLDIATLVSELGLFFKSIDNLDID